MWPREQTEAGAVPNDAGKPQGGSRMNGDIVNAEGAGRPRPAGSKFTYSSGTRPLEGYTIKRGVGIGGFGEVYFATSDAGKEVALKRIQRNLDIELRGVRQCLNLKHQNLVALYDIKYDEQEQAWVVMEFVPGASLKDIIEQHPQGMPIEDVHRWFRGLAAGTAYLHDHGIVHRDLKPGNVFEDDGCVKIGDYGLSKFISCSRRSGQTESVGTFHYMAPEIGKGNYGREIDIYALGIILYEMLTGNVPFDGESTQEIIMKHLTADPDVSKMAQPYRYVIQRALLKDPQKRFNAVYEMVDALGLASPSDISAVSRGVARPIVNREIETPPLAMAMPVHEPLFISDDAEMVFGPVKHSSIPGDSHPPAAFAPPPVAQSPISSASQPVFSQPAYSQPAVTSRPAVAPSARAASGTFTSPIPTAAAVTPMAAFLAALDLENEPVARTVRQAFVGVVDWWKSPTLKVWVRVVVLLVAISAALSITIKEPSILLLFVGYAVYLGIRFAVKQGSGNARAKSPARSPESGYAPRHGKGIFSPSSGATLEEAMAIPPIVSSPRSYSPNSAGNSIPASVPAPIPTGKFPTTTFTPDYLRRERRMMLLTSLFASALFAIALSIASVMVIQQRTVIRVGDTAQVALITWLAAVSIGSVWSIQLVSRLFDTTKGTAILHRIVMGAIGAIVGCGAIALQRFLEITELPANARFQKIDINLSQDWPATFTTVAFFFALFAIIRWWKHSSPMRTARWHFGAVAGAMVFGWLIGMVVHFPQPWPIAIAGILAISIQLGSARYSTKRRSELKQPFAISA